MTEIELIINQFILEQGKLYTLPELYHQLEKKILSQSASIDEIGEIISTDAALSARLLKIANSPLYGFRSEISTLNRALTLIGVKEVKNLILLDTLSGQFNDYNQCTAVKMEDFWYRSVYLALIAKRLATVNGHKEADQLFISAIMSRLGQLVCCSVQMGYVAQIHHEHSKNLRGDEFAIEKSVLGFTYNEMSAKILQRWKVPESITASLQYLHAPFEAPEEIQNSIQQELMILNVATIYSGILEHKEPVNDNSSEFHVETSETYLSLVDPAINDSLNINTTLIDALLFEIEIDAMEILRVIFPNSSLIF